MISNHSTNPRPTHSRSSIPPQHMHTQLPYGQHPPVTPPPNGMYFPSMHKQQSFAYQQPQQAFYYASPAPTVMMNTPTTSTFLHPHSSHLAINSDQFLSPLSTASLDYYPLESLTTMTSLNPFITDQDPFDEFTNFSFLGKDVNEWTYNGNSINSGNSISSFDFGNHDQGLDINNLGGLNFIHTPNTIPATPTTINANEKDFELISDGFQFTSSAAPLPISPVTNHITPMINTQEMTSKTSLTMPTTHSKKSHPRKRPRVVTPKESKDDHEYSSTSSPSENSDDDFKPKRVKRSSTPSTKKGKKSTRKNFPQEVVDIFTKWLDTNTVGVYPSVTEKTEMMKETGLTREQVDNWFINARRRRPEFRSRVKKGKKD